MRTMVEVNATLLDLLSVVGGGEAKWWLAFWNKWFQYVQSSHGKLIWQGCFFFWWRASLCNICFRLMDLFFSLYINGGYIKLSLDVLRAMTDLWLTRWFRKEEEEPTCSTQPMFVWPKNHWNRNILFVDLVSADFLQMELGSDLQRKFGGGMLQ